MPEFTLPASRIVAIWVETFLYGVYSCLFFASTYIILRRRSTMVYAGKVFLVFTSVMYTVATLHIAINLHRLLSAFVWLAGTTPSQYFSNLRHWEFIAHDALMCVMTWLGDALVIYRCFIIWNNRYAIVALPFLLLLASIGINSVVLYWFATGAGMRVPRIVFKSVLNAIYPISFLQNTLTTGLIAYRLIRQHRQSSGSGVHQAGSQLDLYTIIRILIESAMLYTLELLLVIVLYALKHHAQYVVMYAMSPTIGIVFTLIACRIHLNSSKTLSPDNAVLATMSVSGWPDRPDATELGEEHPGRGSDDFEVMKLRRLPLGAESVGSR